MILPDWRIENLAMAGAITPFDSARLQPASYDMTLDRHFRLFVVIPDRGLIDLKREQHLTAPVQYDYYDISPGQFILASSVERFKLPHNIQGRCDGKSSLGRLGLMVHVTAGNFDPGFEGTATLELFNANKWTIRLYPGMPIAQMVFQELDGESRRSYRGKYHKQGDDAPGPRESEYYKNFVENQTSDSAPRPA